MTHLSGTPSHWRKALMTSGVAAFHPQYVRLSGEIADQAVLDALRKAFPHASIGHAFASTEAGVGFAVNDGLEGFPAAMLEKADPNVVRRVLIVDAQGNKNRFDFSAPIVNKPVPKDEFDFTAPPGTKVVKP